MLQAMRTSCHTGEGLIQLYFDGIDEGLKEIKYPAIGLLDDRKNFRLQQGTEHQRPLTVAFDGMINLHEYQSGFFKIVQKRHINNLPIDAIKLGQ